jgi:hypothetical protein
MNPRVTFRIVSLMILEKAVAQFALTVFKSTGLGALINPRDTFGSFFIDDFLVGTSSVFVGVFESTGVASADESTPLLLKRFR